MRKIKDCIRHFHEGKLTQNNIAKLLSIPRSTVQDYYRRVKLQAVPLNELLALSDTEIDARLFHNRKYKTDRTEPDATYIHAEMTRRGVTLMLLWEEYLKDHPNGLRYTQFCERHRAYQKTLKTHLRQTHVGGEKAFVDYSGLRPSIVDFDTGESTPVEIFVFCWGASHCLYVEAQESQSLGNFVMGHVRAFEFFGCVPRIIVPDNLKAAVTKAHRYDPALNPTYCALSEHYAFAPLPARPYKPKDKSKVEVGVQIIQRWIIARLRKHIFHTLQQLNASIRELLLSLNQRPLKQLKKARWDLFLEWDLPNALPLSKERFVFHTWQKAKVGIDYCVQINKHYYSVPSIHAGKDTDVKLVDGNVEVFLKGERVAFHKQNEKAYGHSIDPQHMPEKHRQYVLWTPHRILTWAEKTGPHTRRLIEKMMHLKPHAEMAYRPSLGILRLSDVYGKDRLENAAKLALEGSCYRVAQIAQILKRGQDRFEEEQSEAKTVMPSENIRGAVYFQERTGL